MKKELWCILRYREILVSINLELVIASHYSKDSNKVKQL